MRTWPSSPVHKTDPRAIAVASTVCTASAMIRACWIQVFDTSFPCLGLELNRPPAGNASVFHLFDPLHARYALQDAAA